MTPSHRLGAWMEPKSRRGSSRLRTSNPSGPDVVLLLLGLLGLLLVKSQAPTLQPLLVDLSQGLQAFRLGLGLHHPSLLSEPSSLSG